MAVVRRILEWWAIGLVVAFVVDQVLQSPAAQPSVSWGHVFERWFG